jgi:hypothetical protein
MVRFVAGLRRPCALQGENNQMLNSHYEIGGASAHEASAGYPFKLKIKMPALLALGICLALGSARAQTQWTPEFADDKGWDHPEYATTIMFGDINGDAKLDVCGRRGRSYLLLVVERPWIRYSDFGRVRFFGPLRLE